MIPSKFGVEIEFLGLGDENEAPEQIDEYFFNEASVGGGGWRIHHDGSVRCECDYHGHDHDDCDDDCPDTHGAEIVSRPLRVCEDSFNEVRKMCKHLDSIGAYINETCGLHVHVDASFLKDLPLADQRAFFEHICALYASCEDAFDTRMSSDRKRNRNGYCRTMKGYKYNENGVRYHKLNVYSFIRHGTIEFRHHHGTLDDDEMVEWIKTCLLFFAIARESFVANLEKISTNGKDFLDFSGLNAMIEHRREVSREHIS